MIFFFESDNAFYSAFLEHPTDSSTINWISGQTVKFPADNSTGFAFLDSVDHSGKKRANKGFFG
ncbi:MAG: hypothetical protein WCG99_04110 [Candidatus Berkelbacteria bacterium]